MKDNEFVSVDDLVQIGERVLDMVNRLQTMEKFQPGTKAKTTLKVDDEAFIIEITKERTDDSSKGRPGPATPV